MRREKGKGREGERGEGEEIESQHIFLTTLPVYSYVHHSLVTTKAHVKCVLVCFSQQSLDAWYVLGSRKT